MGESVTVTIRMSVDEARARTGRAQRFATDLRNELLAIYEGEGWAAMEYASWTAYLEGEFKDFSRPYLIAQVNAARTERVLYAPDLDTCDEIHDVTIVTPPIPESHLRPLRDLAEREPDQARTIWREAMETAPNGKMTATHVKETVEKHAVHYSSESPEWYTPTDIIERASRVMLGIGLDPCADPERRVPAQLHFTASDDGLAQEWPAVSVWMNPPYGREITPWVQTWLSHTQAENEGMALLPARTDTDWFQPLFAANVAFCFIDGRLKFSGHKNSAPFPSVIAYSGDNLLGFYEEFHDLGGMVMPWCPEDADI